MNASLTFQSAVNSARQHDSVKKQQEMLRSGVLPAPSKVDEMNEAEGKQERRPRKPKYRRPQKTTLKMLRVRLRNRYDINNCYLTPISSHNMTFKVLFLGLFTQTGKFYQLHLCSLARVLQCQGPLRFLFKNITSLSN